MSHPLQQRFYRRNRLQDVHGAERRVDQQLDIAWSDLLDAHTNVQQSEAFQQDQAVPHLHAGLVLLPAADGVLRCGGCDVAPNMVHDVTIRDRLH